MSGKCLPPDIAALVAELGDEPEGALRTFSHRGAVWRWVPKQDGAAAWFFLIIDGETAEAIRAGAGPRRGFGSIRVRARIGNSAFATSLFPSKEMGGFLLPLKASVRKAEKLAEGSAVKVELELA